jgi:alpha-L-fucosidase
MAFRQLREEFYKNNVALRAKVEVSAERTGQLKSLLTDGFRFSYWAPPDSVTSCWMELTMENPQSFNTIVLEEYTELGQRVKAFTVEVWDGSQYKPVTEGSTIGKKRILQFPLQTASKIRVTITGSKAAPVIGEIQLYNNPFYQ